MDKKKYKLLKNFTPRDLYDAQAPIELFLKCKERRGDNLDLGFCTAAAFIMYAEDMPRCFIEPYGGWSPWLIENKFIEEYEEDSPRDSNK